MSTGAAEQLTAVGVTIAHAAGWDAEPLMHRGYGGEGLELAQPAGVRVADAVLVGSRGLGDAEVRDGFRAGGLTVC